MTLFKLEQFPHVCRLCLRPDPHEEMVPLSSDDDALEGTIGNFIANITFVISKNKSHLFPQNICSECHGMIKYFGKFRTKVMNVHLLMNSLVELKHGNPAPIEDLFRSKRKYLHTLFKDLGLCSKSQPEAVDLINEFSKYEIASIASPSTEVDEETPLFSDEESMDLDESDDYTSDTASHELAESTQQTPNESCEGKTKPERISEIEKKTECDGLNSDINSQKNLFIEAVPRRYSRTKAKVLLRCNKCKYETFRRYRFKSHQLTHYRREFKKYYCNEEECCEVFDSTTELRKHRAAKHKSFMCEICGYKTALEISLLEHKERHMNLLAYTCKFCQRKYNTKSTLRLHIRSNHIDAGKHECKTCGKQFKGKPGLITHEQTTHSDTFNFPCDKCDGKFKSKVGLNRHVSVVHNQSLQTCQHCGLEYNGQFRLHEHIESVHHIRVRFVCDVCVGVFYSQEDLDNHALRHRNPKELECATCLSVYRSQEQFDGHMCISYRDDYICCGKDWRHFQKYNNHMFMRHGERTNVRVKQDPNVLLGEMRAKRKRIESCSKCDKIFPTRKEKQCHMETCVGAAVESITK